MAVETFTAPAGSFDITIYPARNDKKRYPILLLLHGNFGLGEPYGSQINGFAESLAGLPRTLPMLGKTSVGLGYLTAVPNFYSDDDSHPTDQDPAPHLSTLAAAIQHVSSRGDADATRVGLIGYSLGAAIAMTYIAGDASGHVKVLVDYFGPTKPRVPETSISPIIATAISRFPPTLTFHDVADLIVPVDRSIELHALLPDDVEHRLSVYVTEPPQPTQVTQTPGEEAKYLGNHAFEKGGYADVASRNEAATWIVRHMPPTGVV